MRLKNPLDRELQLYVPNLFLSRLWHVANAGKDFLDRCK